METDVFKLILCHLQNKLRISHKYIAPQLVFGHSLEFPLFELGQHLRVIRFNPAGFVHLHRLKPAPGIVFMLQPELNHFKLKLPDGS